VENRVSTSIVSEYECINEYLYVPLLVFQKPCLISRVGIVWQDIYTFKDVQDVPL
jgi:hypothetical protein